MIETRAPNPAQTFAIPLPMPLVPPVMMTDLFFHDVTVFPPLVNAPVYDDSAGGLKELVKREVAAQLQSPLIASSIPPPELVDWARRSSASSRCCGSTGLTMCSWK